MRWYAMDKKYVLDGDEKNSAAAKSSTFSYASLLRVQAPFAIVFS